MGRNDGAGPLIVALALIALAVSVAAPPARAQSEPTLRHGPVLALGYEYGDTARIGMTLVREATTAPGEARANYATELALDVRLPLASQPWILSARWPAVQLPVADGDPRADDLTMGNLGLTLTRVTETAYSAESFMGLLVPAFSIGVVLPTSPRELSPTPSQLMAGDAVALYRRDTAAVTVATHLRVDFFLFHGGFLQTSPELQVLDTGDVLLAWNSGVGFGLGSNRSWEWVYRHARFLFEHSWIRELGDRDLLAPTGARNANLGTRMLLRYGLHTRWCVGGAMLGVVLRWNQPVTAATLPSYPTLDVHLAF